MDKDTPNFIVRSHRGGGSGGGNNYGRWNPTTEQLRESKATYAILMNKDTPNLRSHSDSSSSSSGGGNNGTPKFILRSPSGSDNSSGGGKNGSACACGCGSGGGYNCGRWYSTTEQLRVLTDLFRSGLRTPNTDQIQQISTQLGIYGKIEPKNVFYWFQNHKALEKRRRVSVVDNQQRKNQHRDHRDKKESSLLSSNFPVINNEVSDVEKTKETLQLFPMNKLQSEKLRLFTDDQDPHDNAITGADHEMHPTLNLSLSFL